MLPKLICCFTKLHSVVESTAQPSLPLHESDREELSSSLSELPLESQVEELSRRYVLPFSMLGLLCPASGRGGASAQSALSQGSGFQCSFPRTEMTVLNLLWSSPAHREVFPFVSLQAWLPGGWEHKSEGCSEGDCDSQRGWFLTAPRHSGGSEG